MVNIHDRCELINDRNVYTSSLPCEAMLLHVLRGAIAAWSLSVAPGLSSSAAIAAGAERRGIRVRIT